MRVLAVLSSTIALIACAGPNVISPVGGGEPVELRLKAGDAIRVVTIHRERASLRITDLGQTELTGVTLKPARHETLPKDQEIVVPYGDLALVEVRRFGKGGPAAAAGLLLIVTAGAVIHTMPPPMTGP
jgi:hypothetical protein